MSMKTESLSLVETAHDNLDPPQGTTLQPWDVIRQNERKLDPQAKWSKWSNSLEKKKETLLQFNALSSHH